MPEPVTNGGVIRCLSNESLANLLVREAITIADDGEIAIAYCTIDGQIFLSRQEAVDATVTWLWQEID